MLIPFKLNDNPQTANSVLKVIRIMKHAFFLCGFNVYTIFATGYALISLFILILDIISPLNETRRMLYSSKYVMSQKKYYHTILLNEYVCYIICALVAKTAESTYILL